MGCGIMMGPCSPGSPGDMDGYEGFDHGIPGGGGQASQNVQLACNYGGSSRGSAIPTRNENES